MKIQILLVLILTSGCMTGYTVYEPEGPFKVIKVIDGDTIDINKGGRIRLIGINTPEKGECYYKESKDKLKELVFNKIILIEKDNSNTDKYGRKLRIVYVNGLNVNSYLVEKGYAEVFDEYPSSDYKDLKELEKNAKEKNFGIWNCLNTE